MTKIVRTGAHAPRRKPRSMGEIMNALRAEERKRMRRQLAMQTMLELCRALAIGAVLAFALFVLILYVGA